MFKKHKDFEVSDEILSRRLWRKAISIDDENAQVQLHKETFNLYQTQAAQDDAQSDAFPACVKSEQLRKALFALTAKQRKVVELYYFQNLTQADISQILSCSQVAVSKILCRAIEKIKASLGCA